MRLSQFMVLFCFVGQLVFAAPSPGAKRQKLEAKPRMELLKLLQLNEQMHAAFFKYNAQKVHNLAQKMAKEIKALETPELKKLLASTVFKLEAMIASAQRKDNNRRYHHFSLALVKLIKKYDMGADYNHFNCPMVKMHWVQNTTLKPQLENPYAPWMPHCGSQLTKF